MLAAVQVFFNNTSLQYYSQIVWSQCVDFAQKVIFQLQLLGYHSVTSAVPGSVTLSELYNATVNVTDITTKDVGKNPWPVATTMLSICCQSRNAVCHMMGCLGAVGQAYLSSVNTTMECITDPYAQDHSLSGATLSHASPAQQVLPAHSFLLQGCHCHRAAAGSSGGTGSSSQSALWRCSDSA